jgi:hypothetical protein
MATRLDGETTPNTLPAGPQGAPTGDVWIEQRDVITQWGLGDGIDLWDRLEKRSEEVLLTGGLQANYWQALVKGRPCPCIKSETQQPDNRCPVCYGTRFVGGYERYGFATLVFDASFPGWLTGLAINTQSIPPVLQLPIGSLQGTAETGDYMVTSNLGFVGSVVVARDGARKATQNNVLVEVSTDGGETWGLPDDRLQEPTLMVRFRVTLSRPDTQTESPQFTVLRARFQQQPQTTIRFSKKIFPDQRFLETIGVQVKLDGMTFWTTATAGNPGGPILRVSEQDFLEILEGFYIPAEAGVPYGVSGRFKPANVALSEPAGRLLSQRWNIRPLQKTEIQSTVF